MRTNGLIVTIAEAFTLICDEMFTFAHLNRSSEMRLSKLRLASGTRLRFV